MIDQSASVIILAAGLGTRMRSAKAKVLHEAGGDTLLNQIIETVSQVVSPDRIVAVVGHQADQVKASVRKPGVRFAIQREQKGTGHAVLCAREEAESSTGLLLILNGDGPLLRPETILQLIGAYRPGSGGCLCTTVVVDSGGYGRITRNEDGSIRAIVEQKSATAEEQAIREINAGAYCFEAGRFWQLIGQLNSDNAAGEYYLTDMVALLAKAGSPVYPVLIEDQTELLGINTRVELATADGILRTRKVNELMLSGVTIERPETVTVDRHVIVGRDSIIESGVQLRGQTVIGENCHIGAGSILRDCRLANGVKLLPYVVAEFSAFGERAMAGPFSRLRMNAEAKEDTHIGNFVELKKTILGRGSKANHLAYLGDGTVGEGSNIGAGTIFCNYDGVNKHPTMIGDRVFVGSNSTLVAPITVEDGAYVAAGSTVTRNVEADSLALGRSQQVDKPGWAKRRREMRRQS